MVQGHGFFGEVCGSFLHDKQLLAYLKRVKLGNGVTLLFAQFPFLAWNNSNLRKRIIILLLPTKNSCE